VKDAKMFGLTKREQRWKAEQQAGEVLASLIGTVVKATAEVRVAEANADASELERLRAENGELRRLLARYRDETPLGNQPHMIAEQADGALGRGPNI
jgi:cell division protein FtsB